MRLHAKTLGKMWLFAKKKKVYSPRVANILRVDAKHIQELKPHFLLMLEKGKQQHKRASSMG